MFRPPQSSGTTAPSVLARWAWLLVFCLLMAACSGDSEPDAKQGPVTAFPTAEVFGKTEERSDPEPTGRPLQVAEIVAVDTSKASVDLDDIVFDTFGGPALTLADSTTEERAELLDLIPPLDDPDFMWPADDPWLEPEDRVLGYVDSTGQAYAFPHKMLALHEIVNMNFAGQPAVVTYCPLCESGVIFDAVPEGSTLALQFSNTSALLHNDMVMVDRQTGSYWWQVAGKAVVGELTDTSLPLLSSSTHSWESWFALYPETVVLSRNTGYSRDYTEDRFEGYAKTLDEGFTPFPVPAESLADTRLSPATRVVVVEVASQTMAVAIPQTGTAAVAIPAGEQTVTIMSNDGSAAAWIAELDGQPITISAAPGTFLDADNNRIDLSGRVLDGPAAGSQLASFPSRSAFWFSVVTAFPDVIVVDSNGLVEAQEPEAQADQRDVSGTEITEPATDDG